MPLEIKNEEGTEVADLPVTPEGPETAGEDEGVLPEDVQDTEDEGVETPE